MIRPRAKENQRASIEAKRGNSITDTFLAVWRDGMDRFPNCLKRIAMMRIHARKILIDRLGDLFG